jgi:hypothetical protein
MGSRTRPAGIHPTSGGNSAERGRASNHATKESNEHELEHAEIRALKEIERQAILVAVKRLGVHGAAAALGIGKTTIHRKLRDYQNTTQSRKGDGGLFLSQKSTSCLRRQRRPQNFLGGVRERWHPVSVTSWMLRSRTFGSYALRVPTRVKSLSRSAAEKL